MLLDSIWSPWLVALQQPRRAMFLSLGFAGVAVVLLQLSMWSIYAVALLNGVIPLSHWAFRRAHASGRCAEASAHRPKQLTLVATLALASVTAFHPLILTALSALLLRLPHLFVVAGPSMFPTLCEGDIIVIRPAPDRIASGSVVVLARHDVPVVKRVVAVAGQHVERPHGELIVDGRPLIRRNSADAYRRLRPEPVRIPKEHLYVLGDNSADSLDSRDYGPVSRDKVVGVMSYRLWAAQCLTPLRPQKMR